MESFPFECVTCKLNITGYSNFQRHVNSIEHANRVQNITSNNVTDEDKVITSKDSEEPTSSTINPYLPSSSNLGNLACELCQKRFSGTEPYQQHLASAGHKKKVESLASPNSSMSQLRCKICDKDFSGQVCYEQHIVSKAHKKKAVLSDMDLKSFPAFLAEHQTEAKRVEDSHPMEIGGNVDNFPVSDTKPITSDAAVNASVFASQLLLRCDVCDKSFNGPAPYQQHMESQIHKKKALDKEMLKKIQSSSFTCQVDSASNQENINGIDKNDIGSSSTEKNFKSPFLAASPMHPLRCADCDKNFTGRVPYDQHMASAMHLKKMLQKKQMNGEANIESNIPSPPKCDVPNSERYFCKMCDKQCSGPIPFTQHLMSEVHRKKEQIFNYNRELNDLSKSNDLGMDDDQMSTDDNYANECSKKSSLFSSSELSFNDVLKEINHVTPNTLNVTVFRVADDIVF